MTTKSTINSAKDSISKRIVYQGCVFVVDEVFFPSQLLELYSVKHRQGNSCHVLLLHDFAYFISQPMTLSLHFSRLDNYCEFLGKD